jgi:hypothetical protein
MRARRQVPLALTPPETAGVGQERSERVASCAVHSQAG